MCVNDIIVLGQNFVSAGLSGKQQDCSKSFARCIDGIVVGVVSRVAPHWW